MEVEGVSKHEEAIIVWIGGMSLNRCSRLIKELPVFTILETDLYEDAVRLGGEVSASHDLAYEVDFGFVIRLDSHDLILVFSGS